MCSETDMFGKREDTYHGLKELVKQKRRRSEKKKREWLKRGR